MRALRVAVLGAGITGLFVSYYLRKKGYDVTVIEKSDERIKTSQYNAGLLTPSTAPAPPIGMAKIASTVFGRRGAIYISPMEVLRNAGWFVTALRSGFTKHEAEVLEFGRKSLQLYKKFFGEEPIDADRIDGILATYKDEKYGRNVAEQLGGRYLDGREVAEMGLLGFGGGAYFQDEISVNPFKLTPALRGRLAEMGVEFQAGAEPRLVAESKKVSAAELDGRRLTADSFVVAAGSWSRQVLRYVGYDPKVLPARGLAMIFDTGGVRLFDRGLLFEDYGISVVQHDQNVLRITSFFELVGFNEVWGRSRKEWLLRTAERHIGQFGKLKLVHEGMGYRPCTPDQLPVIGPVPKYENLYIASGNCRLGMTLAPATGYVIASLIDGNDPHDLPWHYFEAARFSPSR